MTPGHYLVLDIFFPMIPWWGAPSGVLSNAAVSMDLAAVAHVPHVNKSGFFKQTNNCVWHGRAWTMWFWYSEVGEKKQSSWNFLFPHSLMAVLACGHINAVTRPMWSTVSRRTTVIIGYVTSSISDGNARTGSEQCEEVVLLVSLKQRLGYFSSKGGIGSGS